MTVNEYIDEHLASGRPFCIIVNNDVSARFLTKDPYDSNNRVHLLDRYGKRNIIDIKKIKSSGFDGCTFSITTERR